MTQIITATEARSNLYKLIDNAYLTHEPCVIKGKRHNAVLIAQEDWQALQETLYLVSIPGMRESLIEGLNTSISDMSDQLNW